MMYDCFSIPLFCNYFNHSLILPRVLNKNWIQKTVFVGRKLPKKGGGLLQRSCWLKAL
uniref:Uncharacterized protein n=1 Tax=Meloidogyne enterolobii TaxID=390850 RepID=A0A6V7ULY6_MELEN|nr:unnamed protein product [Meloidogyne enterolobii]